MHVFRVFSVFYVFCACFEHTVPLSCLATNDLTVRDPDITSLRLQHFNRLTQKSTSSASVARFADTWLGLLIRGKHQHQPRA